MLKLKLKPTNELGLQEIQCYNVSVSPDLSHISGRTSNYNSLLNGELVKVVNNENNFINSCKVDTENVKVQGKVALEITLPIKKVKKSLLLPISSTYTLTNVEKNYVEYNGAFSYEYNGSYLVDGKLYHNNGNNVIISTFAYIEDGKVIIGDKEYIADFRGGEGKPDIKESKYATALNEGENVTPFIKYKGVYKFHPNYWTRETKFNIWKDENENLSVETILYGAYEHYIDYDGERYYLKSMYDASKNYKGYGVEIDGQYYSSITRSVYDGEISVPNDYGEPFGGSLIRISTSDVDIVQHPEIYYEIQDSLVSPKNGGRFLFLITKSESLDLKPDDIITAKSNGAITTRAKVEDGHVTYLGKKYDVINNAYEYITVGDNEYRLMKDSDGTYATINGNKIYYSINGTKATPNNKIYYSLRTELDTKSGGTDNVLYGIDENGYTIIRCSGVTINNEMYKVITDEINSSYSYIVINEDMEYSLVVSEKTGSSTYLCYPYVDTIEIINTEDSAIIQRSVCDMLIWNNDKFTYQIRNDVFGDKKIYPDTYLYEAATSTKPFCTTDVLNLSIFKINKYINLKFPIVNGTLNDIMADDIAMNILSRESIDRKKTKVVDMEKDIYYPVWQDSGGTFNPITNIRFNLHFRTRQLDNWKVIEDYNEDTDKDLCNWVITDYKYYKDALTGMTGGVNKTMQNASDLIGFMNFTTSEVKNMSNKIAKSFLRLSFYSTDNPQTQVLLSTSTIFLDEAELLQKYMSGQKGSKVGKFIKTKLYQMGVNSETNYIGDDTEYGNKFDFETNEPLRLSSRLNVYDKHVTKNSSEGFYFYMFREYANNMRPLTIYLKIDFNHAGIGRTIQFMLPRGENGKPLYIHKPDELEILKQGFTLKDIYKQIYIPINVIYDDKTNKYVYYLPNDLRENEELGISNDIMEFNLFEVKFKDESVNRDDESNQ